eukprot:TRINITY_DN1406_c0_g3_i2.p1 TRINITY_DN1406_c0_g3~~TRINITY_DN1406_c0_g3_i2.p1  ORF type:complete len:742 (+),score=237.23 TRINITY_DN1406_c0_g3_i2:86-2311(+)
MFVYVFFFLQKSAFQRSTTYKVTTTFVFPWIRRSLFTALSLVYALCCMTSLGLVHCITIHNIVNLDENGDIFYTNENRMVSNSKVTCFEGDHRLPAGMAFVCIIVFMILYPIVTFFLVNRVAKRLIAEEKRENTIMKERFNERADILPTLDEEDNEEAGNSKKESKNEKVPNSTLVAYGYFIGNSYKNEYFWFRHIDVFIIAMVSFMNTFFARQSEFYSWLMFFAVLIAFGSQILLVILTKPFLEDDKWKLPIKVSAILIAGITIAICHFNYLNEEHDRNFSVLVAVLCAGLSIGMIVILIMIVYLYFSGLELPEEVAREIERLRRKAMRAAFMRRQTLNAENPLFAHVNKLKETQRELEAKQQREEAERQKWLEEERLRQLEAEKRRKLEEEKRKQEAEEAARIAAQKQKELDEMKQRQAEKERLRLKALAKIRMKRKAEADMKKRQEEEEQRRREAEKKRLKKRAAELMRMKKQKQIEEERLAQMEAELKRQQEEEAKRLASKARMREKRRLEEEERARQEALREEERLRQLALEEEERKKREEEARLAAEKAKRLEEERKLNALKAKEAAARLPKMSTADAAELDRIKALLGGTGADVFSTDSSVQVNEIRGDWSEVFDKKTGRICYFCVSRQSIQWRQPAGWVSNIRDIFERRQKFATQEKERRESVMNIFSKRSPVNKPEFLRRGSSHSNHIISKKETPKHKKLARSSMAPILTPLGGGMSFSYHVFAFTYLPLLF